MEQEKKRFTSIVIQSIGFTEVSKIKLLQKFTASDEFLVLEENDRERAECQGKLRK